MTNNYGEKIGNYRVVRFYDGMSQDGCAQDPKFSMLIAIQMGAPGDLLQCGDSGQWLTIATLS